MIEEAPASASQDLRAAKATSPVLEFISRHFDRKIQHRFNGFGLGNENEFFFDPQRNPQSARSRACVSVEWSAFAETAQDAQMVYIPCGISSGLRVHEAIDEQNHNNTTRDHETWHTTWRADDYLGQTHKKIIAQNRDDNLRRARVVQRLFPESIIVAPVIREGAHRALNDHAFAGGQRYEEEDYMAFWYPVIDCCSKMVLDGDWNFSRNSIWEMMRGVLIQTGQIPSRRGADMDVVDIDGKPLSLQWRTEKLLEMLKYQLGKGFDTREAATALAQIFTLDDELRSGRLSASNVHPILRNRDDKELAAMDQIKADWKPILIEHCAQYMRLQDLPEEYQAQQHQPKKLSNHLLNKLCGFAKNISQQATSICSFTPTLNAEEQLKQQRLFDSYERFFEPNARAKLFEDDLYSTLSKWERLALPFAIGATETGLYPANEPAATAIFTDLKRGKEGFKHAQEVGCDDMRELAGALGRNMPGVQALNKQDAEQLKAVLKEKNPTKIIINTPSFLRIAETIDQFRSVMEPEARFVAAPGTPRTSASMRLAMQMKFLDRSVDTAVFQEGWEYSNDLVQLRVRARMLQAGLIDRPAGEGAILNVVSMQSPDKMETLLDDIKTLKAEVERTQTADVSAPEQALALARLIALHELLMAPELRETHHETVSRELINPLKTSNALNYDRSEAQSICEEAKSLLITSKALLDIPRERLEAKPDAKDSPERAHAKRAQNDRMDVYIKAQAQQQGLDYRRRARRRHDELRIEEAGARR